MFAWATSAGAKMLLESPDFEPLLTNGSFRLVVGTDSITDTQAIDRLDSLQNTFAGLEVEAVVNDSRSLFHPKMAWFLGETSLSVVVGSGNLTRGGLLGSWEAFGVLEFPISYVDDLEASIDDWLSEVSPGLLGLQDARVLERVAENKGYEVPTKPKSASHSTLPPEDEVDAWLIAELNKSRKNALGESMFSQASFDKGTFASFFDFSGSEVDIILFPVDAAGEVGSLESRKGRFKANSVNYYFELGMVQGVPYPTSGRPIAVFGRLSGGGYMYTVVLEGDPGHGDLSRWLDVNAKPPNASHMSRAVVSTAAMRAAWPGSPMFKAVVPPS